MAGSEAVHRAPYADDAPRELTDEELSFLSDYTGERDLPALRQHVLSVWRDVKAKARRLAQCAQAFVLQLDSWRRCFLAPSAVSAGLCRAAQTFCCPAEQPGKRLDIHSKTSSQAERTFKQMDPSSQACSFQTLLRVKEKASKRAGRKD